MPRSDSPPRYCRVRHHGRLRGRVWFRGRWKILPGDNDSPESRQAYEAVCRDWRRDHEAPGHRGLTVGRFALEYLAYAETRYVKRGEPTSEVHNVRTALRWLVQLFRSVPVGDLHAGHVETFQDELAASGNYNRRTINQHVGRLRRAVRWGVSRRLVPTDVLTALESADPLRRGRLAVRERQKVRPVPLDDVEAVLPLLPRGVAGAVRFQLHTGCRPGEALVARECDIDAEGDVWTYTPGSHKNEHHDQDRVVFLGPNARAVVNEYLLDSPTAFLFGSRTGKPYRRDSYRTTIRRACARAGVRPWNPHQLRHTFGTLVRKQFGLEAAQLLLGHAHADVTEIYAERDQEKAREVAARIG